MRTSQTKQSTAERAPASLYEPLDFFQLRAPLLPVEAYVELRSDQNSMESSPPGPKRASVFASEPCVRRALAVGSLSLVDALGRTPAFTSKARNAQRKLLRYMIRMSTRPTPFGLFAGVALGCWGERTHLGLASAPGRLRTRPDMQWLMTLVLRLESNPEIRKHLRVMANPAAFIRAGRVFLTERVATSNKFTTEAVSLRATGVVRRVLQAARDPIPHRALAADLLVRTPGATPEKIENLLTELWKHTVVLTDLRPPLTVDSPARYVVDRLEGIPAAAAIRAKLASLLEAAAGWDRAPMEGSVERYRALVSQATELSRSEASPFQVDMALELGGDTISRTVGEEAARAAELLLRIGPQPQGHSHIVAYRRAFERRYGLDREVPVLELLDPNFGLGPPSVYSGGQYPPAAGISQPKALQHSQALMELALTAGLDRSMEVNLDEQMLKRLETWTPLQANAPESLELFVFVGASSRSALDAGHFQVVLGPNVGGLSAGRSLGRFADLLGESAKQALTRAAANQEARTGEKLWAELVYQPRQLRSANVSIRPNVRRYEIALGVTRGNGTAAIPIDELVVGIRNDRFYLSWPPAGRDVVVTGGHMLNYLRAPAICRFLTEISRDGSCQLSGFQWGTASNFGFLPRVRVGRIILSPAQWRIRRASELSFDDRAYQESLDRWREKWRVPRHVYLSSGDNRLLLDLSDSQQADELRRSIQQLPDTGSVLLTEVLPGLDQAWVLGPEGCHFMTELAVSLVLRHDTKGALKLPDAISGGNSRDYSTSPRNPKPVPLDARLRLPGSEWLFVKLYGGRTFEDDLIAGVIRSFAEQAISSEMAEEWFFLRYSDPDSHIRLRFRGDPKRLTKELYPAICDWATELIQKELCLRFAFDAYEREVERYGGLAAARAAEALFFADSRSVAEILDELNAKQKQLDKTSIAVLSVDELLGSMGLDEATRVSWYDMQVRNRKGLSAEYRKRKISLRSMLGDPERVLRQTGAGAVAEALARRGQAVIDVRKQLAEIESRCELTRSIPTLCKSFVHLHLNRLLGVDGFAERQVLEFAWRTRLGLHHAPAAALSSHNQGPLPR